MQAGSKIIYLIIYFSVGQGPGLLTYCVIKLRHLLSGRLTAFDCRILSPARDESWLRGDIISFFLLLLNLLIHCLKFSSWMPVPRQPTLTTTMTVTSTHLSPQTSRQPYMPTGTSICSTTTLDCSLTNGRHHIPTPTPRLEIQWHMHLGPQVFFFLFFFFDTQGSNMKSINCEWL